MSPKLWYTQVWWHNLSITRIVKHISGDIIGILPQKWFKELWWHNKYVTIIMMLITVVTACILPQLLCKQLWWHNMYFTSGCNFTAVLIFRSNKLSRKRSQLKICDIIWKHLAIQHSLNKIYPKRPVESISYNICLSICMSVCLFVPLLSALNKILTDQLETTL